MRPSRNSQAWSADPGPWTVPDGVGITERLVGRATRRYTGARVPAGGGCGGGGVLVWVHGRRLPGRRARLAGSARGERGARGAHGVRRRIRGLSPGGWRGALSDPARRCRQRTGMGGSRHSPPTSQLAIGGASAGAALALAATMRVRDAAAGCPTRCCSPTRSPIYPNPVLDDAVADRDDGAAAHAAFPGRLDRGDGGELCRPDFGHSALALPGAAPLGGLPPVHVMVSEFDDLRASGELLERQLAEAGVPVTSYVARGMPHGHLNRLPSLPEVDRSLDDFARVLRAAVPRSR